MREMKTNLSEAIKNWKDGKTVWSAELGGIGPGYEQAIQVLLWEIVSRWDQGEVKDNEKSYPENYNKHVDGVTNELDKIFGFSGAQVGVAKATAYQFLKYGYSEMMNKLPDERWIQVDRHIPNLEAQQ
jgi:hypothetical protein